nr:MAG TPA: hypothetical protein [Caudoviricetes sp.]
MKNVGQPTCPTTCPTGKNLPHEHVFNAFMLT